MLTRKQKENLSKAIFDVGKLILATVVLGRLISDTPLNVWMIISGIMVVVFCFIVGTYLDKGE